MRWEFLKITKFARLTILLFVLLLASNCVNFGGSNIGYIVVAAKFPQNNFKIKNIPAKTTKIVLVISGDGINLSMSFTLTPTTSSLTIPAIKGNKNLSATAFDESGEVLAFGKNKLYVYPDLHNKVEIILIEGVTPDTISDSSSSNPSNNISATPTQTPSSGAAGDNDSGNQNNIDSSASPAPSDIPSPTATPIPSSSSNSNSSSTTYTQVIDVNVNLVASTPIPSGISLGMLGP